MVKNMKIAVFGGTFDPPHTEHANLLAAANSELAPDWIYVVPAGIPPHKTRKVSPAPLRLNMTELFISGQKNAQVYDGELLREGKSYTVLTLRELKKQNPDAQLLLLMGADMLKDFPNWKNPQEILSLAHVCVCLRGEEMKNAKKAKAFFKKRFSAECTVLSYHGREVSSTAIRCKAAIGLDYEKDTLPQVGTYLRQQGLYLQPWTDRVTTALSPKRKEHTLGVMLTALSAAKRLGVHEDSAFTAAALHDVAKAYPDAFSDVIPSKVPGPVKHQYAGAELAKREMGITDNDVLNAIRYHTSARAGMSNLEKLIYVADMIEPGRNYPCVKKLRKLFDKNFEQCFLACLKHTVKHLKKQKKEVYPLTEDALRYYRKRRRKNGI